MTKNEFDILYHVSLRGSAALSDLHKHFAKAFSSNYVALDLVLIHLLQLEYLKSEPALDSHLDPYAVFTLTPAGAHAIDEYSENTSRLDRAEASAVEANTIAKESVKESQQSNWWAFCAFVVSLMGFIVSIYSA